MSGIIVGEGSKTGVVGQQNGLQSDLWRLTSGFTGAAQPIASGWERVDTDGEGQLGIGMFESSGIFTFPVAGIWKVDFGWRAYLNGDARYVEGFIYVTEDAASGASYSAASYASTFVQQTNGSHTTTGMYCSHLMNVLDTANIKVRFDVGSYSSSTNFNGDENINMTYGVFTRLGDS